MCRLNFELFKFFSACVLSTGCPVTDGGTLSLIENLQFCPKKVPKANTNPKHDSI